MAKRLTTFSKLLITLVILAVLFFGGKYLLNETAVGQDLKEQAGVETATRQESSGEQKNTEESKIQDRPSGTFDFEAPKPQNGRLKGVVELGASGFNSFIINEDKADRWELKKAEYGASLVYENMASEQDVRDGLKKYIATMLDYGVDGNEIHFMVSSSAIKNDNVQVIRSALKSLGYVVNSVDAEQEGKFALQCVLPKEFESKGFVVDIGSGNTKISWLEGGNIRSLETYGSKYYQDEVSDGQVYTDVRELAAKVPKTRRNVCFIIGGAPFKLAKENRKGKERYTVLAPPRSYESDEEKVKAGINIYKALVDGTSCNTFVFDWDANFTIGFLLSLD
jgi:hypothetical protein